MKHKGENINIKLKLSVAFVSLLMPVAGFLTGLYYGFFVADTDYPLLWPLVFFVFGVVLDVICVNGKVFSFVFYKMPIPIILGIIAYEAASFFLGRMAAVVVGFCGIGLGVLIDMSLVSPKPFYLARKRVLIIVYVFMSVIMMGIMMGVPISNFLLGILTGNYYSLRYSGAVLSRERLRKNLVNVTSFATIVLFVSECVFGWLLWQDSANIVEYLWHVIGIQLTSSELMAMIIGFGLLSVVIQFAITCFTAKVMYKYRACRIKIKY